MAAKVMNSKGCQILTEITAKRFDPHFGSNHVASKWPRKSKHTNKADENYTRQS